MKLKDGYYRWNNLDRKNSRLHINNEEYVKHYGSLLFRIQKGYCHEANGEKTDISLASSSRYGWVGKVGVLFIYCEDQEKAQLEWELTKLSR